jgi:hypothetical protein
VIAAILLSSVIYRDVPPDVVAISARRWRADAAPISIDAAVSRSDGQATISGGVEGPVVVYFQRTDGAYLLDGPFEWPREEAHRPIDPRWRRTIIGARVVPGLGWVRSALEWTSRVTDPGSVWPSCHWISDTDWQCIGVPLRAAGVVGASSSGGLFATVVTGVTAQEALILRPCDWGRLVVATDAGGIPSRLRIVPQRAVVPPQRTRAMRLETSDIPGVVATAVDAASVWICGRGSPEMAWIDARSARGGPMFVPLSDASDRPPFVPMRIDLADSRVVSGSVMSADGLAAANALLAAFRLIEPRKPASQSGPAPKRVLVAETLVAADGTFEIAGIGEADYEIVAWHPQFGRAAVAIPGGSGPLAIRLHPPPLARGRVVSGGKPLAGIDVIGVPDPAAFAAAEDPLDVKSGDARTAADGRFTVALASTGGGELRIGGGSLPVKRIPLPRTSVPLIDLGDIDLGAAIEVTVILDQDPGCELQAAGPVGRSGLQIVQGLRTVLGIFRLRLPEEGTWALALICGTSERALSPATIQATPAMQGKDVRVIVR